MSTQQYFLPPCGAGVAPGRIVSVPSERIHNGNLPPSKRSIGIKPFENPKSEPESLRPAGVMPRSNASTIDGHRPMRAREASTSPVSADHEPDESVLGPREYG